MKTAGRENPNRGFALPRNRAHGAVSQNRSRSLKWAEKQENFQPKEMCFFLTSTFIELTGTHRRNVSILLGASNKANGVRQTKPAEVGEDLSVPAMYSGKESPSLRSSAARVGDIRLSQSKRRLVKQRYLRNAGLFAPARTRER